MQLTSFIIYLNLVCIIFFINLKKCKNKKFLIFFYLFNIFINIELNEI